MHSAHDHAHTQAVPAVPAPSRPGWPDAYPLSGIKTPLAERGTLLQQVGIEVLHDRRRLVDRALIHGDLLA